MKLQILFLVLIMIYPVSALEVSTPVIRAAVTEGDVFSQEVSIINGDYEQQLTIDIPDNTTFIHVSSSNLFLSAKDYSVFGVTLSSDGLVPGVYASRIEINGEENIVIPVAFEVESLNPSFDVSIDRKVKEPIFPGDSFKVDVKIYRLRSVDPDLEIEYSLQDLEGNVIFSEEEPISATTNLELTKEFNLNEEIVSGTYVISVLVKQADSVGTSSFFVDVDEPVLLSPSKGETPSLFAILFFICIILIISFFILNYYWNQKLKSNATYWNNKVVSSGRNHADIKDIKKLEYEKNLLEQAYHKGYIQKSSYDTGLKKINQMIIRQKKRL